MLLIWGGGGGGGGRGVPKCSGGHIFDAILLPSFINMVLVWGVGGGAGASLSL